MKPFFPRIFSTRNLVIMGMSVPVLLMILVGCLEWKTTRDFGRSRDWVTHSRTVLFTIESYFSSMKDAEAGQRGYLLTHKDAYLDPYKVSLTSSQIQLQSLRDLIADDPDQAKNIDRLEALTITRFNEMAQTIALEQHKHHVGALKIVNKGSGKTTMDQIRSTVASMQDIETKLLKSREDIFHRNSRFSSRLAAVLVVLGLSFMIAIVVLIRRIEQMQGMITICAWSKLIDYEGEWLTVEQYLSRRLNAKVTHGISRAEAEKMLKMLEQEKLRVEAG